MIRFIALLELFIRSFSFAPAPSPVPVRVQSQRSQ